MKRSSKSNHVVVRFRGGLGNQLFQYWTAVALAHRVQADLWFEPGSPPSEIAPVIDLAQASPEVLQATLGPPGWKGTVVRSIQGVLPARLRRFQQERFGAFRPGPLGVAGSCFLDGFWQSVRYFSDLPVGDFDNLRARISQLAASSPWVQAARSSVVVHVERVRHLSMGVALPGAYYQQALDRFAGWPVLAVTDDQEFCRQVLAGRPGVTLVSSLKMSPWQTLDLLIHGRAVAASNSTLSWWGAFLNPLAEQIVVPNGWLAPDLGFVYSLDDLYPPSWVRI